MEGKGGAGRGVACMMDAQTTRGTCFVLCCLSYFTDLYVYSCFYLLPIHISIYLRLFIFLCVPFLRVNFLLCLCTDTAKIVFTS